MEKVTVIFAKGKHPYSYLTRIRFQSMWSHCGVLEGNVVHETIHPQGVVKTPLAEFLARYGEGRVRLAECYAEEGWRERANTVQSAGYDFWGAFGLGIGTRKFDHPDKLWCSHHVAIILGTGRPERYNRLSPEHIWINSTDPLN